MEWQHAHGRSWLGIVTVAGLWLAASFLAAPDARATDGAVEQIEQIADDATNAIGDRADAYLDFLATGPDRAQAQSELMTAAGEIELLAADADAAITGMMVLHPLDGDVQEAGADTKVEVREAAADTEAIMSAAYAVFVAQNPTTTTTTTTTSTSTTTSAPPTTTTTTAATAATAPPTTTTTTSSTT
ncbi:MAG: hypothetical protein OEM97_03020, partial [Acidimicrobiia bacterium]|nr:hypothetical protein [Acidimicrobiia bacterium]